jgi:hypothetical protein
VPPGLSLFFRDESSSSKGGVAEIRIRAEMRMANCRRTWRPSRDAPRTSRHRLRELENGADPCGWDIGANRALRPSTMWTMTIQTPLAMRSLATMCPCGR